MVLKLPARMKTVRHSIRLCHHFLRIYIEFIVMMVNVKDLFCIQCIACELLLMQNNLQLIATLLSGLLGLLVASLILQALCIVIYQWRKKIFYRGFADLLLHILCPDHILLSLFA